MRFTKSEDKMQSQLKKMEEDLLNESSEFSKIMEWAVDEYQAGNKYKASKIEKAGDSMASRKIDEIFSAREKSVNLIPGFVVGYLVFFCAAQHFNLLWLYVTQGALAIILIVLSITVLRKR